MAMTMPELISELQEADQNSQLAMFVDRRIVPIAEIIRVPGSPYVFLCEQQRGNMKSTFTESEKGFIGYCSANGITDDTVTRLLGRSEDSIARLRKKLGF